ncbi:hypothetical protein EV421DRAFT_1741867 [Armillaria borealis]|uniref:Uncharacterized protein n=1 Tax=Armillaria borealis TaxID=47425 RepID=A0AA39MGU7_9AGAR|nr:hypothetical protein EV421DRAFT_1741867 [Armillaria borealis]
MNVAAMERNHSKSRRVRHSEQEVKVPVFEKRSQRVFFKSILVVVEYMATCTSHSRCNLNSMSDEQRLKDAKEEVIANYQYDVEMDDEVLTVKTPIAIAPSYSPTSAWGTSAVCSEDYLYQINQRRPSLPRTASGSRSSRKTPRGIEANVQPKVHWINPCHVDDSQLVWVADVFGLLYRNEDTKILAIDVQERMIFRFGRLPIWSTKRASSGDEPALSPASREIERAPVPLSHVGRFLCHGLRYSVDTQALVLIHDWPSVRVNRDLLDYDKRHNNALPQRYLVLVSSVRDRPSILVLVLFVAKHAHEIDPLWTASLVISCRRPLPLQNIPSEIADVLVESERRNRPFAQEPKHGSGKDETGTSPTRRRRSLVLRTVVWKESGHVSW